MKISFPWLFSQKQDLLFFFLPVFLAVFLSNLARQDSILHSPILFALVVQGFGIGDFHQGGTLFHYFDSKNREHYQSNEHVWRSMILPAVIVVLSAVGYFFVPLLFIVVYVMWTIQHIAQQNVGILLLYHNQDCNEAIVDRNIEVRTLQASAAMFSFLFLDHVVAQNFWVTLSVHLALIVTAFETIFWVGKYLHQLVTQLRLGKSLNAPAFAFWVLAMSFFAPFGLFAKEYAQGLIIALVMHWFQYIGLNATLVKRKYATSGNRIALMGQQPMMLFCALGVLYALVAIPVQVLSAAGIYPDSPAVRIVAGVISGLALAHYFVDAFMWRFRDQFNRETLLAYLKPQLAHRPALSMIEIESRELVVR